MSLHPCTLSKELDSPTNKRKRPDCSSGLSKRKKLSLDNTSPDMSVRHSPKKTEADNTAPNNSENKPAATNCQTMEEMMKAILDGQNKLGSKVENLQSRLDNRLDILQLTSDTMNSKLSDMQQQIETFANRIDAVETDIRKVKSNQEDLKEELKKMTAKFRDMKDAQLRSMEHTFDNYLIFKGIPEKDDETDHELKIRVNQMIAQRIGITAPCTSAVRVGKPSSGSRPTRVYWVDQVSRKNVLKNSKKLLPVKISKDLPLPVRKVQQKIKTKGWELRQQGIDFKYCDLGLEIQGTFVHHEDLILESNEQEKMDSL